MTDAPYARLWERLLQLLSGWASAEEVAALYPLPEGVSWKAGIFTEPLSAALHAITLADIKPGEWVGVVGGGAVGMLLLQLAHQQGANVLVSEPEPQRRAIAKKLGAEQVVDPRSDDPVQAALDATGGIGLDRVIEAVGRPQTVQQAMQMARRGGTVVVMGVADQAAEIPIRPYDLYQRQLTLKGSFIRNFDFQRAVRLLPAGTPLVWKQVGLPTNAPVAPAMPVNPAAAVEAPAISEPTDP